MGPQAQSIEEAAQDVGKWLNERPSQPLDLRHVAMLCHYAQTGYTSAYQRGYLDGMAKGSKNAEQEV